MGPLQGIRVIDLTAVVMGPSASQALGDMGAAIIKVESPEGDITRQIGPSRNPGMGAMYLNTNRNKRSICLNLKDADDLAQARRLVEGADVLIENFRPGALERLGLGPDDFAATNPGLIYCSAKGFLSGPYEHRTALDEVTQMMGGLAYMTGPPGQPLRAGASVIDITGGMFGVIGILAALNQRHSTGKGASVKCSLFETTAFLVGQHMAQQAVTGAAPNPMPARISAWAVYDVFETAREDERLFVGVVSDSQWVAFCTAMELSDLGADPTLTANNDRVRSRDRILPRVRALFATLERAALIKRLEAIGLPFAPVSRPDELFDDPHLNHGGLVDVTIPGGAATRLPGLPLEFDGRRLGLRYDVPVADADRADILNEAAQWSRPG